MREYHADITALRIIQVTLCLMAAGLTALAALFLSSFPIFMWIAAGIFAGIGVLAVFFLLPLLFRSLRCVVTATQVTVHSGIILRREQSIRLNTVQFVQIISGPFDGILGMNFVILHVYGGQLAVLFLSKADRKELAAFLCQKGVFHVP